MKHLDEGTIHAWLDGALDAAAEQKAEEHAARCTACASAVADARGLIAATSRILTALDDVPSGVLPPFYAASPAGAPRRIPVWALRAAASLFVVAAGTALVVRNRDASRAVLEQKEQPMAANSLPESSVATAPMTAAPLNSGAAAPADTGRLRQLQADPSAQPMNAPALQDKANADASADEKAKLYAPARGKESAVAAGVDDSLSAAKRSFTLAEKPAAPGATPVVRGTIAPAPKADANEPDLASAKSLALAPKAPKVEVSQATGGAGGKAATENQRAALPPGMRLVDEETQTLDARLVQRKVYEVRPGLKVTLAIFAAPPAESRSDADSAARDSADRRARREFKKVALGDETAGINSIQWSDSLGTEFTLSGPLPLDSLRALKPLLPQRIQRQ